MSTTVGCDDPMAALLGDLRSPTRNRYFYGKLLDATHLRLEQAYVNQMRWLMNRLSLGTGVLCGLRVGVTQEGGKAPLAHVEPGVAVDGLGREIIVPTAPAPIDFLALAAKEAIRPAATRAPSEREAAIVVERKGKTCTLFLCYHECCAEPTPVLVTDECEPARRCEAGLVRERYRFEVRPGSFLPPPNGFPDLCKKLLFSGKTLTRAQRLALLCSARPPVRHEVKGRELALAGDVCSPPDEICVPLAILGESPATGKWTVAECPPPRLLLSNEVLLEMILCLADCCKGSEQKPPEVTYAPHILKMEPAPGVYRDSGGTGIYERWARDKSHEGWTFEITFSEKMQATYIQADPGRWLRVYLTYLSKGHRLEDVALVRLDLANLSLADQADGSCAARFHLRLPTDKQFEDAKTDAQIRAEIDELRGTPISMFPGRHARFVFLMHAVDPCILAADGHRLLNASYDGMGATFDQPQQGQAALRKSVFDHTATVGQGMFLLSAAVWANLPGSVPAPLTPSATVTESWFSAALDFLNDR